MRKSLLLAVGLASACSSGIAADPDAGAGGWNFGGSPATTSSSVTTAGSSSSLVDASADGDARCSMCAEVLHATHDPDGLCPDPAAFAAWVAYVNCGCAKGGSCAVDCTSSLWCKGVFPTFTGWVPPEGKCAACLGAEGGTGCWDQARSCEWN